MSFTKKYWILVFFLFLSCQSANDFFLEVAVLQSPYYPSLEKSDIEEIFASAQDMVKNKFGAKIIFQVVYFGHVDEFFNQVIGENHLEKENFSLTEEKLKKEWLNNKKAAISFLKKNFRLKELNQFLKAKTYESFWEGLGREYMKKFSILKNYRLKNGQGLWTNNPEIHSYRFWKKIMRYQKDFDFILTNIFVFYDDFEEPYPHAILKHAKISGASFDSPNRRGILLGSTAFASVFEIYSNEDYFLGIRTTKLKTLSRSFLNKAFGSYLLAHEIGHQLFWIPDVYDHPEGCLMDTRFENMEIGFGYELLKKNLSPCVKCQKYVNARQKVLQAQKANQWNKLEKSLREYPFPRDKEIEKLIENIRSWYSP